MKLKILNKLFHKSKYLTLVEAGQRGLLPSRIQNTKPYERDKDPMILIDGFDEN